MAPRYEALASKYPSVVFLKVNVDNLSEVAASQSVRAMPTFKIYKTGRVLETVVGADIAKVERLVAQFASGGSTGGRTLSGSNPSAGFKWDNNTVLLTVLGLFIGYLWLNK